MLLSTTSGVHAVLDAFKGGLLMRCQAGQQPPTMGLPLEACFAPDSGYLMAGAEDGGIYRWQLEPHVQLPPLREHSGPVGCVRCNPTKMMVASADKAICLWLPDNGAQQRRAAEATGGGMPY